LGATRNLVAVMLADAFCSKVADSPNVRDVSDAFRVAALPMALGPTQGRNIFRPGDHASIRSRTRAKYFRIRSI
jgi:hypothetical protein